MTAIPLADALDAERSEVSEIRVGGARRALHVVARSASRPAVAWEALVVATKGGATVVWSGATGFGAQGEGAGARVAIDASGAIYGVKDAVYVGRLRRELTICGQEETLLEPRRLDPASMALRAVTLPRLAKSIRENAVALEARQTTAEPLGSVLGLRGASTNDGAAPALVDQDPATVWADTRTKGGKGEFAVFSSQKAVSLVKLSLVLLPTVEREDFVAPASIYVVVDDATYRVALPAVTTPGSRVDISFPAPVATTCVAVALDGARVAGNEGFAEVEGVPAVPPSIKSLEEMVTLLDAAGANAELAHRILAHAGARGAKALGARVGSLGDVGKERAVDILESTPPKAAAPGLARLAWDAPKKIAAAARVALDGCGIEAREAIADAFAAGPDAAREALATRFARLDPPAALSALLNVIPAAAPGRRRSFRAALAVVATRGPGREAIARWLASWPSAPTPVGAVRADGVQADAIIELARAIAPVPEIGEPLASGPSLVPSLTKALVAGAGEQAPFERRWLAAAPVATLGRRGDVAALGWVRALFASADRDLRARAAEVSAEVDALRPEVLGAVADREPRVRQRALEALRGDTGRGEGGRAGGGGALSPVIALLAKDGWTFVRVAAAELLGDATSGGKDVDVALAQATHDGARPVRAAAVRALASRHAIAQLPAVRARAFDGEEGFDVREAAIDALGTFCDVASVDDLSELARRSGDGDTARQLALAAINALGNIHPADLQARLGALGALAGGAGFDVKYAVRQALRAVPTCR